MIPRPLRQDLTILLVLGLACIAMMWIPSAPKLAMPGGKIEQAQVVEVDNSTIDTHGLLKFGSQKLKVKVLTGSHAGETIPASNELRAQLELDKIFQPGDDCIVVMPQGNLEDGVVINARDHDRSFWLWTACIAFCVVLCVFGSWTGAKALFSFFLSCLVIWKLVIPLTLRGWSASWIIFGCVVFLTAAIQFLVAGLNRKGVAAFSGAIAGVFTGLLLAHGFTAVMKINGAVLPYAQTLLYSGYDFLDLQDLFVGAMILASSGAVMDLAMDISAGVCEVAHHSPKLSRSALMASGIRMGRSVVGTMTTTLLLAYSGGYITLLMMFYSQDNSLLEIMNNPLVASEAAKTLIGSFSLILVAPFTALFAALLFANKNRKNGKKH